LIRRNAQINFKRPRKNHAFNYLQVPTRGGYKAGLRSSGDSRIKKWGGALQCQGKGRGTNMNVYPAWPFLVGLNIN